MRAVGVAQPLPAEIRPPHADLRGERNLSVHAGLPYSVRLKLYMKRSYVSLLNVQSAAIFVTQPVVSPSLIRGKYADRIGCVRNGVIPSTIASRPASTSFQRRKVRGRITRTATNTAGNARKPAMWLA